MKDGYETLAPIAMPGIHERFVEWLVARLAPGVAILDVGAGRGAMCQAMHRRGFGVAACDRDAAGFAYPPVEFRAADITERLPWPDGSFDVCLAVEVTEHIHDHGRFFGECARVLRPGGRLYVTTPNILSLKSRLSFLLIGYPYSFRSLDLGRDDGLQHVAAYSLGQYRYVAHRAGFSLTAFDVDKLQNTSIALLPLWPILWFFGCTTPRTRGEHNCLRLLLGRVLFMEYTKR